MKRARLIYNPSSGREEIRKNLPGILERLEQGGLEVSTHATTGEGCATRASIAAIERGFDIVIAAGGDGTLYEVINGLGELDNRPTLGIIPGGTSNDFARALGIPRQWEAACDIITTQHAQPIDIGKMNDKYFINIAGGGHITELTYEVPSKLKTMFGQLAYYAKGLEKLIPSIKPIQVRMETAEHGVILEEEIQLFLIANSGIVGGFEQLVPMADLQDGIFDCIVLKKTNIAEFVRVVTLAARGEHFDDERILHFRTSSIKITSPEHVQINLDGELGGTLPCTFSVLPNHLNIIVPEKRG